MERKRGWGMGADEVGSLTSSPLRTGPGTWKSYEGCSMVSRSRGQGGGWAPTCDKTLAGIPSGQGMDAEG